MSSLSATAVKDLFSSLASSLSAPTNDGSSAASSSLPSNKLQSHASLTIFAMTAALATLQQKYTFASVIGGIYNTIIVKMTEVWYKQVLEKQTDGATILDIGIGTAGALLRCKDIIQAKNLKIIGVDYNNLYIQAAQQAIMKQNMSQHISVHTLDIYNEEALQMVLQKENISFVDSAYFSGSFSLMPDPKGALAAVKKVLSPSPRSGNIYITQTYQKRTLPLMTTIKPMLKFITTVDFGQLVTVEAIDEMLNDVDGMDLVEHGIMEGSVDTYWQAAYLSVLTLALTKDGKNEMKKERSDL